MPQHSNRSPGSICLAILIVLGFGSADRAQSHRDKFHRQTTTERSTRGEASPRASSASAKLAPEAGSGSLAEFDSAATANRRLLTNLDWTFGGKRERGWQIYAPLIAHLIGSDAAAPSSEFAKKLARWQGKNGLEVTGVLDNTTLLRIISTLQSNRIKDRSYPPEDQLVTIPVSDCYDPTRAEELRRAERKTYKAYKRMVAGAAEDRSLGLNATSDGQLATDEKFLKIISAFRSREHQDQLRKQSPKSGRAALAVNSPHFTGRALDLYVGGEPVSSKDENRALQTQTKVYLWLVKNAARFGFQPYFYEPWHWEYVGK